MFGCYLVYGDCVAFSPHVERPIPVDLANVRFSSQFRPSLNMIFPEAGGNCCFARFFFYPTPAFWAQPKLFFRDSTPILSCFPLFFLRPGTEHAVGLQGFALRGPPHLTGPLDRAAVMDCWLDFCCPCPRPTPWACEQEHLLQPQESEETYANWKATVCPSGPPPVVWPNRHHKWARAKEGTPPRNSVVESPWRGHGCASRVGVGIVLGDAGQAPGTIFKPKGPIVLCEP